jgi:glycosyltransferase involved in cell wall biosynthesis
VLLVSLGSTGGWQAADSELYGALRRAGATVALCTAQRQRNVRTLMLTDLLWARAARVAALEAIARHAPAAVIYSTTTAALLWPVPGAIRLDALAAANRPGRHGLWQRPIERRRLATAPLLLPCSDGALGECPGAAGATQALVLPIPVAASGPPAGERDIAAITYAANPAKKGTGRVLEAWARARRPGEEMVVVGASVDDLRRAGVAPPGPDDAVRVLGMLGQAEYRAMVRRSRLFVCAPRREDYGIAQLEALVDGCMLATTPSAGPYAALPLARAIDGRLVSDNLEGAIRAALDAPLYDYASRAQRALAPFTEAAVDRAVRDELLPALLLRRRAHAST